MKISKYIRLVKNCGRCVVADVAGSGIWLGTSAAMYRATSLPKPEGREQTRALLDVPEKAWEKIHLTEESYESARNVLGMNLTDYDEGEMKAEKLRMMAAPNGLWAACVRCEDGELLFYQESMLAPVDEIEESEYIIYTVRRTTYGQRFLVVHDGMNVLAAVMPMKVISEKYLADLSEFQALCTEQFYRERERAERVLMPVEEPEAEQIGMEDAADE